MLATAGGAGRCRRRTLTPARLADELARAVADPARSTATAGEARALGKPGRRRARSPISSKRIAAGNTAGECTGQTAA